MARTSTFTTWINTAEDPADEQRIDRFERRFVRSFSNIARAADQATRAAAGLTGGRGTAGLGGAQRSADRQASGLRNVTRATEDARKATERSTRSQRDNSLAVARATGRQLELSKSLRSTSVALQVAQGPLGPLAGRITAVANALEQLTGFRLGIAAVGATLFGLGRSAIAFTELESSLRPLFKTQNEVNGAFQDIIGIAARSRSALEPIVELYARLQSSAAGVGLSQDRVTRVVEIASKASTLSGGSQAARSASLVQFSQALGADRLSGQELNSIKEQNLELAKAIALGFKNADGSIGSTIGKLKELGEAGELTTKAVVEALERQSDAIEAKFSRLPKTLSSSTTEFTNALTVMVGRGDQALGVTSALAETISFMAHNLEGLLALAVGVGAGFAAIKAVGLAQSVREIAGGVAATLTYPAALKKIADRRKSDRGAEVAQSRGRITDLEREKAAIDANVVALRAEAVEAAKVANSANRNAKAGFPGVQTSSAIVGQKEANDRLRDSTKKLSDAQTRQHNITSRLAIASERHTGIMKRYDVAVRNSAARSNAFASAGRSLLAAINPVGIGVALLTTALFAYATSASAAERAMEGFSAEQRNAIDAINDTTVAIERQTKAQRINSQAAASRSINASMENLNEQRGRFAAAVSLTGSKADTANDRLALAQIAARVRAGAKIEDEYAKFDAIRRRNPRMSQNGPLAMFGIDNADKVDSVFKDVARAAEIARTAAKNGRHAFDEIDSVFDDKTGTRGKPPAAATTAELRAGAIADAINNGTDTIRAAGARRSEALSALDREFGVKGGKIDPAKADEYKARAVAIEQQYNGEVSAIKAGQQAERDARRAARQETATENKRRLAEEKALRQAAGRGERRSDIMGNYDDEPRAIDRARDEIDDLQKFVDKAVDGVAFIGKTREEVEAIKEINPLGAGIYTQAMADADKANIERGVRKPMADMLVDYERQAQIQELILQGRDAEAKAYERAFDMADRIGVVKNDDYQTILRAVDAEEKRNDLLESRGRIVSAITGAVDEARDGVEQMIVDFPEKGFNVAGEFLKNMQRRLLQISAKNITEKLFAGADAKVRALLSGRGAIEQQTTFLASKMADAGTASQKLATSVEKAAERIANVQFGGDGGFSGSFSDPAIGGTPSLATDIVARTIASIGDSISLPDSGGANVVGMLGAAAGAAKGAGAANDNDSDVINVIARKAASDPQDSKESGPVLSGRAAFKAMGEEVGGNIDKIFNSGTFFKKIGGSFGTALQGAGEGAIASGFMKALGVKQSKTGAQIGGAIGAMSGIPGGGFIGGAIGGTIGGFFKKDKFGSSTLSIVNGEAVAGAATGRGKNQISTANALGGSLAGQLNQIADLLGGELGTASVSIGYRPGHKAGAFRVDPTGQGRVKNGSVMAFETEEEAIAAAVRDAVGDGVIVGISQASQRILKSGQDLEKAIEKAAIIESIPKRLLQKTDPVRFAVDELNREFTKMIAILKEGGATSEQFADAQKLYELERADAIKAATSQATAAIDEMLKNMKGGSESPLRKKTVFENASAELDKFTADINAGKIVDQNDLLSAARNFEDASRALNGSSQAFFDDFNFLFDLLSKARDNAGISDVSSLPPSPFANDTAVQNAIANAGKDQVAAINSQTLALLGGLGDIASRLAALGMGGGGTNGSALSLLARNAA